MGLPENYFREKNPAAIIAKVNEITLAVISQWDERELIKVGWLNNELIKDIYYLNVTTGVWTQKNLGDGSRFITDQTYIAARLLSGANSVADLLDDTITALGVANGHLNSLSLCIDANRLKTIETP